MDPLSLAGLAASISGLVDFTAEVISCLYAVKGAGEERRTLLSEIVTVYSFLERFSEFITQPDPFPESHSLAKRLVKNGNEASEQSETVESASRPNEWTSDLIPLLQKEGILEQGRTGLASVRRKPAVPDGCGKRFIHNLQWPVVREDIRKAVEGLHRLRTLITSVQLMHIHSDLHKIRGLSANSYTMLEKQELRALREWLSPLNFIQEHQATLKAHCIGTGIRLLDSVVYKQWKAIKDIRLMWCHGGPGSGKTFLASIVANDLMTSSVSEAADVVHNRSPERKPSDGGTTGKLYDQIVLVAYCKIDDPNCQILTNIIGDILRQSLLDDLIPSELKKLFDKPSELGRPLCDQLIAILGHQLRLFKKAYLVIDALDEIAAPKTRSDLLKSLNELPANVMILSRNRDDIEKLFGTRALCNCCDYDYTPEGKGCDHCKICIPVPGSVYQCEECVHEGRSWDRTDVCPTCYEGGFRCSFNEHQNLQLKLNWFDFPVYSDENDLKRYVLSSAAVKKWGTKKGKAGFEDSYIAERIVKQSQQLFLVARLLVERIDNCRRRSDVRKVLEAESVSLEEAFDDTIRRIKSGAQDNVAIAWEVLTWMLFCKRPLRVEQMQHALAVQVGTEALEAGDLIQSDHLISVCAGLIRINGDGLFRFIHSSVKPYLLEQHRSKFEKADEWIAQRFLTYLRYEEFRAGPCSDTAALKIRLSDYPLYRYAAYKWYQHMREVTSGELRENARSLWQNEMCVASIRQAIRNGVPEWPKLTVLHYSARIGAANLASELIRDHISDLNALDFNKFTPLMMTVLAENETDGVEFAEHLIDAGANPAVFSENGEAVLHLATRLNMEKMVDALIAHLQESKESRTKSADQACNEITATTPAADATRGLNLRTQATDEYKGGDTALIIATKCGHTNLVRKLCDAGTSLDIVNGEGYAALHFAAKMKHDALKHDALVNTLLQAGADINLPTGPSGSPWRCFGETPLTLAARCGNLQVVQLLVKAGADLLAQNSDGDTALHNAVMHNHGTIVRALLDAGVDINITTNSRHYLDRVLRRTPLILAAREGHLEICQLLIKNGADILAEDSEGKAALHHSAAHNHPLVVAELLTARVDSSSSTSEKVIPVAARQTALMDALRLGHEEVVNILLRDGADPLVSNEKDMTAAFHQAIYFEHSEDIEKLLELNASKKRYEATCKSDIALEYAFKLAAWCGKLGTLRFFLEKGVSPNPSVMKTGLSALMEALAGGNVSTAELLLQQDNIDVRMKCPSGRTALHFLFGNFFSREIPASKRLSLARKLVKAGANIYEKDIYGLTALYDTAHSNCTEGLRYLLKLDREQSGDAEGTERACNRDTVGFQGSSNSNPRLERFDLEASAPKSSLKLLHRFVCRQNFEAVRLLVEHGAKISTSKAWDGLSAIDDALYCGQKEMIELFMKIEPDHPTLQKTKEAGFLQLIKKSPNKVAETVALEENQN